MQSGFISLSLSGSIQISIISWHLRPLSLSQSDWDKYQQATSIVMTASIFRWRSEIASSYAYLRDRFKWREPKRSSSLSDSQFSLHGHIFLKCIHVVQVEVTKNELSVNAIKAISATEGSHLYISCNRWGCYSILENTCRRAPWECTESALLHIPTRIIFWIFVLWELEINLSVFYVHFCLFHIWLGPGWPRRNAVV